MEHIPVLLRESIEGLTIKPNGIYVDGTMGLCGHSLEIAKRLGRGGRLISIDRDGEAIAGAKERLCGYEDRVTVVRGNFGDIERILKELEVEAADGLLFDFGTASPQLDNKERGFSYMHDGEIDMRLDTRESLTAQEIVNTWTEDEISRILYEYGEERYSKRIARAIVRSRESAPIKTAYELNEIIISAMPGAARRERQHPSKRSYQALRIAVNDELGAIERMLESVPRVLRRGGKFGAISFHSLEDRLVKNAINRYERGCVCPGDFPECRCGFEQTMRAVTRKPITPGAEEVMRNPRSRSAKLRIAERV